jgi:cytochrome c biogenesis protein CcdA
MQSMLIDSIHLLWFVNHNKGLPHQWMGVCLFLGISSIFTYILTTVIGFYYIIHPNQRQLIWNGGTTYISLNCTGIASILEGKGTRCRHRSIITKI